MAKVSRERVGYWVHLLYFQFPENIHLAKYCIMKYTSEEQITPHNLPAYIICDPLPFGIKIQFPCSSSQGSVKSNFFNFLFISLSQYSSFQLYLDMLSQNLCAMSVGFGLKNFRKIAVCSILYTILQTPSPLFICL